MGKVEVKWMNKIREKLRSSSGLTLLEVIIALAIISIISITFLNLFANNYVSLAAFGRKSSNVITASQVLETVYANVYGDRNTTEEDIKGKIENIITEEFNGVDIRPESMEDEEFKKLIESDLDGLLENRTSDLKFAILNNVEGIEEINGVKVKKDEDEYEIINVIDSKGESIKSANLSGYRLIIIKFDEGKEGVYSKIEGFIPNRN